MCIRVFIASNTEAQKRFFSRRFDEFSSLFFYKLPNTVCESMLVDPLLLETIIMSLICEQQHDKRTIVSSSIPVHGRTLNFFYNFQFGQKGGTRNAHS